MNGRFKIVLSTLLIVLLVLVFRGALYRVLVSYEKCGNRKSYELTSEILRQYLDSIVTDQPVTNVEQIVLLANEITADQLTYTTKNAEENPSKLFPLGATHCVGYSAFYATICNYLLVRYGYEHEWHCYTHYGHIHLMGYNLHNAFGSPFFANHDYNSIRNSKGTDIYFTDPTLYDYSGIVMISAN
jgi:hypothetical protein